MTTRIWRAQVASPVEMQRGVVSSVEVAQVDGRYNFKGVATATGVVDRMKRVFLPGAFSKMMAQVPLLAYHDDTHPVGISKLTKKGNLVLHSSTLSNLPYAAELEVLIKDGAIPATSIGWTSEEFYWGFSDLEKGNPKLVKVVEEANIEKSDNIIYFAKAEILENSVTPVPANPLALISVASMFGGTRELGAIEGMEDVIRQATKRKSDWKLSMSTKEPKVEKVGAASDFTSLAGKITSAMQKAHDTLVEAGAVCSETQELKVQLKAQVDLGDDVNLLVATIDAAIDQALDLHMDTQDDEAWLLVLAADQAVDHLLEVMNLPDNSEAPEGTPVPLAEQAKQKLEEFKKAVKAKATSTPPVVHDPNDFEIIEVGEDGQPKTPEKAESAIQSDVDVDAEMAALESELAELVPTL